MRWGRGRMSAELSCAGGAFTPRPSPFRNARLVLEDTKGGKPFIFFSSASLAARCSCEFHIFSGLLMT